MALRKPDGSLRPIAIGETIRRLTSKVAVDLITERARVVLEPLQLGVKTPNGCEAIIHAARQWFACNCSDPARLPSGGRVQRFQHSSQVSCPVGPPRPLSVPLSVDRLLLSP